MKKVLMFAVAALISVGVNAQTMTAKIKNLKDKNIHVRVYNVAQSNFIQSDSVIKCKGGKFSYQNTFDTPVYITFIPESGLLDTKQIRGVIDRETMTIGLYWKAGEKYTVSGELNGNMLTYVTTGSETNNVNSVLRNKYMEIGKYRDMEDEYFRDNKTKKERDSVYYLADPYIRKLDAEKLEYVKNNPDKELAGLFLSEQDYHIFDEYYPKLSDNVKNGIFSAQLSRTKFRSELVKKDREIKKGAVAPDFTLTSIDGKPFTLSAYKGKYVLLEFWGSWCHWCIKGLPEMKTLYEKYKDKVEFVGIACNDKEGALRNVLKEHNIKWDNYLDTQKLSSKYGVTGYPTKILVGPDGNIAFKYSGEASAFYTEIEKYIK